MQNRKRRRNTDFLNKPKPIDPTAEPPNKKQKRTKRKDVKKPIKLDFIDYMIDHQDKSGVQLNTAQKWRGDFKPGSNKLLNLRKLYW